MRRRWVVLLLVVLVPAALVLGVAWGGNPDSLPGFARDAFVDDEEAQVYRQAIDQIADDHFQRVDRDELLDRSLAGAMTGLDPFSRYITPEQYADFEAETQGRFAGIGVNVEEVPVGLLVRSVIPKGPAEKAGIRTGDRIVAVNGDPLAELPPTADKTEDIRGDAGTEVRLTISRKGKPRELTLERANITEPVSSKKLVETPDGTEVAYVTLSRFTSGAHGFVLENIRSLLDQGAEGVVFDMRHNPGGLLQEGVLTASVFIPEGLITYTSGRNRARRDFNAAGTAIDEDVPVVVLVDGASASAAEIVTGALQDYERATVVGKRTFGKGVFQEVEPLPNGGALNLTVGQYFTPDGRNLGPRDGEPGGIVPDVDVEDDPDTKRDDALRRALEVLEPKL